MKTIALGLVLMLAASGARAGLEDVRAAAERGDPDMQFELGELYEFGFRLQDHLVPALAWYIVAAEQGHPKAAARRDALKGRLNAAQVAEAQRQSAKLPRRPAAPKAPAETAPAPVQQPAPTPPPAAAPAPVPAEPAPTAQPSAPLIMDPPTHGPLPQQAPPPAPREDLIGPP